MRHDLHMRVGAWLCLLVLACIATDAGAETLSHGRFQNLVIYRPQGTARELVLFFSGENGWNAELEPLAQALVRNGALVAGIDSPAFFRDLEDDAASCVYPDGDLENLSHFLQAYYRLPTYRPAVLAGFSAGASFVYAMLAQAPAGTFAGGVSLDFCPALELRKPLCRSEQLRSVGRHRGRSGARLLPAENLQVPWIAIRAARDTSCSIEAVRQFVSRVQDAGQVVLTDDSAGMATQAMEPRLVAAIQSIAAAHPAEPVRRELQDLPLVEVAATCNQRAQGCAPPQQAAAEGRGRMPDPSLEQGLLAVLWSGDGGWAGIDKHLAAAISAQGIPVVGIDSLRYFWRARTPQSTAADLERILRYYLQTWQKRSVLLIGFSQGADVLPFAINLLPPELRARLQLVGLLSPSENAVFEFRLQSWLGGADDGVPIGPQLAKLSNMGGLRAMCIYGEDDDESGCRLPAAKSLQVVQLPGGHHFDGDYQRVASLILAQLRR